MDSINLVQGTDRRRAVFKRGDRFPVSIKFGDFFENSDEILPSE
jgi:hypothetical protein